MTTNLFPSIYDPRAPLRVPPVNRLQGTPAKFAGKLLTSPQETPSQKCLEPGAELASDRERNADLLRPAGLRATSRMGGVPQGLAGLERLLEQGLLAFLCFCISIYSTFLPYQRTP